MDRTRFDLGRLLAPDEPEEFLRDTWETRPHVIHRGQPDYFRQLFTLSDLDDVIAFTRPKFTSLNSNDAQRPAMSFVQGWLPDQSETPGDLFPGIGELRETYGRGKSVVIRGMHRRWPAIATFCRSFEELFHCPVHANLYLTPPQSQAFPPHIDTHEVFALQLDGAKVWRLYGQVATLPLTEDKTSLPRSTLGPAEEVRLEAGDVLYLPRGYAHEAATSECASLHLTIGIHTYRWADLLHQALSDITRRDSRFRASLPVGLMGSAKAPQNIFDQFHELFRILAQDVHFEEALQHLDDHFFDGLNMLPGGQFTVSREAEEIDADTLLEHRPGVISRVFVAGTEAIIEFPGGRVAGPVRIVEALRFMSRTARFSPSDLPGDLGDNGRILLAQRMVRAGMLAVAATAPNGEPSPHRERNGATHRPAVAVLNE